jgi:HlyD family secretion protein
MVKRKALYAVAMVLAFTTMGTWYMLRGQGGLQYRTAPVERGEVDYTISATGNPNAVVTVQVGSQVSGNIMALYADFNSKVTKGQLIARIDPAPFQAKVDQAMANRDAAQAAVVNAQANVQKALASVQAANASLANAKAAVVKAQVAASDAKVKAGRRVTLAQEGIISKEDLDTAQETADAAAADVTAAQAQQNAADENVRVAQAEVQASQTQLQQNQAQVKQAQAALESAQIDLNNTYIKTPVDGVVVARNVDVGQTVAASLAAPTLFQIAQDLTKMQVDTNVSEADVGRVQVGQAATFTVDAYPGRVFQGTVTAVREAPINVQNVVTYDVVIGVPNPDLKLFPGMTANVKIMIDQRPNVIRVPNSALRFHPATAPSAAAPAPGSNPGAGKARKNAAAPPKSVWVLDANNKPREVRVTTGETDGTYTEITGGTLKEGDRVILAAIPKAAAASGGAFSQSQTAGPGRRGPGF